MADEPLLDDAQVLGQVISWLSKVGPDSRKRIYQTVGTFFQMEVLPVTAPSSLADLRAGQQSTLADLRAGQQSTDVLHPLSNLSTFSQDRAPTPKQFLNEKRPRTDVERVACLAFYLTHYRGTPEFTTLDISKINTEAAQRKLANAAVAVNNALQYGYLAPAVKGMKQVSASGERYVQVLPDYDAAKAIMATARPRWKSKKSSSATP